MAEPIDLTPVAIQAKIFPGDALKLQFESDIDMSGWNFEATTWLANDNGDGSTGSPIDQSTTTDLSGKLVLTPGATSTLDWTLPGSVTTDKVNKILWSQIRRTDSGEERMYVIGQVLPVQEFKSCSC